jgi:hypothetical protein
MTVQNLDQRITGCGVERNEEEHDSIRTAVSMTVPYVLCGSDHFSFGEFQERRH